MSDKPKRIFKKADDYAVVYADSVIFQGGSDISRLIFFQREVEESETGDKLETKPERLTLKFEVRIPRVQLAGLAENIKADADARAQVGDMVRKGGEDPEILQAWYKVSDKLDQLLFDVEGIEVGDVSKSEVQAEFERLGGHLGNRSR